MIDWLEIRQLAIAEHITLEFGAAFTAVTGETGSGKSLIVDAVGVLLGDRADNALIRAHGSEAEIQGGFILTDAHPALVWLPIMVWITATNACCDGWCDAINRAALSSTDAPLPPRNFATWETNWSTSTDSTNIIPCSAKAGNLHCWITPPVTPTCSPSWAMHTKNYRRCARVWKR